MYQSSSETVQEILHKDRELLELVDEAAATAAKTLKRVAPYWHPYRTYAKQRWWNREILELVSTEFRDRSIEYYVSSEFPDLCRPSRQLTASAQRYALESGVVTVNGKVARPGTIVRNGDRIE
jgi:hypothetical protein